MFSIHIRDGEGTRIKQFWALCSDKTNKSHEQVGDICSTDDIEESTCAYCKWVYALHHGFPKHGDLSVHWSVHPVFCLDGTGRFSHWEAKCGAVDVDTVHVMATRLPEEVTCLECINNMSPILELPPFILEDE